MSRTSSTGAVLDDLDVAADRQMDSLERHTPVRTDDINNPNLRSVLQTFDVALGVSVPAQLQALSLHHTLTSRMILIRSGGQLPSEGLLAFYSPNVLWDLAQTSVHTSTLLHEGRAGQPNDGTHADDAVTVVQGLADQLGLPVRDILKTAGIKSRTFYSWKHLSGSKPQPRSQGRLWEVSQAVEDLSQVVEGSVRAWLYADGDRLRMFRSGRLDSLMETVSLLSPTVLEQHPEAQLAGLGVDEAAPVVRRRLVVDDSLTDEVHLAARDNSLGEDAGPGRPSRQ
jgi:hypothetical protein